MRKRRRIALITAALTAACSFLAWGGPVEEWEEGIEQVSVNMPKVRVFGNLPKEEGGLQAYLNDERLSVVSVNPQETAGTYYYVLLDKSGSINDAYFNGIRQGILNFYDSLDGGDRLILYTFGEDVEQVLAGGEARELVEEKTAALSNSDQETLLFEGIDRAAVEADQVPYEACARKVLIVITDGEDVAVGKKTAQEALGRLREKNLPIYALGVQDTSGANLTSLGEFARASGGQLEVFGASQGGEILTDLKGKLDRMTCVELEAASNQADSQFQTLSLKYEDSGKTLSAQAYVGKWIPDNQAPLAAVTQTGEDQLEVQFDEPVEGAEIPANYRLSYTRIIPPEGGGFLDLMQGIGEQAAGNTEEVAVPLTGVIREDGKENAYLLRVDEPFAKGTYRLRFSGITDVSMEKNPAVEVSGFAVEGIVPDIYEPEPGILDWARQQMGVVMFIGVLVCAGLAALIYFRIKKGKGLVYLNGKVVLASDVDVKQHIAVKGAGCLPLHCTVDVEGKTLKPLELVIDKRLVIGRRADSCDVYFDDKQISRRHFALEWDGIHLYAEDLGSTNGTFLNGERLREKRAVNSGDVIQAGSVSLTVRWSS